MKTITVSIATDGEIKIDAVGFKGGACEKATEALQKALGTASKKTYKPDFYQQQGQGQSTGN